MPQYSANQKINGRKYAVGISSFPSLASDANYGATYQTNYSYTMSLGSAMDHTVGLDFSTAWSNTVATTVLDPFQVTINVSDPSTPDLQIQGPFDIMATYQASQTIAVQKSLTLQCVGSQYNQTAVIGWTAFAITNLVLEIVAFLLAIAFHGTVQDRIAKKKIDKTGTTTANLEQDYQNVIEGMTLGLPMLNMSVNLLRLVSAVVLYRDTTAAGQIATAGTGPSITITDTAITLAIGTKTKIVMDQYGILLDASGATAKPATPVIPAPVAEGVLVQGKVVSLVGETAANIGTQDAKYRADQPASGTPASQIFADTTVNANLKVQNSLTVSQDISTDGKVTAADSVTAATGSFG